MDINNIIGIVVGLVSGAVVAPILLAVYKSFKVGKYLLDGATGLGSYIGKRTAQRVKQIKDPELRKQVSEDIKNAPNKFDEAFDKAFDEELSK